MLNLSQNCNITDRVLVLPRVLHGLGRCCLCPINWQIALVDSDYYDSAIKKQNKSKENKLIANCVLLETQWCFSVMQWFSIYLEANLCHMMFIVAITALFIPLCGLSLLVSFLYIVKGE